jgi:hypothetical protein
MGSITAISCDGMAVNTPIRFQPVSIVDAPLQRMWVFYMSVWRHHVSRRAVRGPVSGGGGWFAPASGLTPSGGQQ